MTVENLYTMAKEIKEQIAECGYPEIENRDIRYELNGRFKKTLGRTRIGYGRYLISINKTLSQTDPDAVKNVLAHELLHTINGGMCHTGEWKKAAGKMNYRYGYNITRVEDGENAPNYKEVRNKERQAKYIVKCLHCGEEYKYYRKGDIVKILQSGKKTNLTCGECRYDGVDFQLIEL